MTVPQHTEIQLLINKIQHNRNIIIYDNSTFGSRGSQVRILLPRQLKIKELQQML